MLKLIPPLLTPDLLFALAAMGHGDELAIVDANFPAAALARKLVVIPGVTTPAMLADVLALFPLDDFVPDPAWTMEIVGQPDASVPAIDEIRAALAVHDSRAAATLERHAFYARARDAFVIVQTGESRKYGNVILKKGVIATQ